MPAKKARDDRLTEAVQTRVKKAELAKIERAMKLEGLGHFAWVRKTLMKRADSVINRAEKEASA